MPDDPQIIGLIFIPAVLGVKGKRQAKVGDFEGAIGEVFDRDCPEEGIRKFKGRFDFDLAGDLTGLFLPGLAPQLLLVSFDPPFIEASRVAWSLLNFQAEAGRGDRFKGQAVEAVEGGGVGRGIFDRKIVATGVAVEEAPADGGLVRAVEGRIIQPVYFDGGGCGRLRKIILDPLDGAFFRAKRKIAGRAAF